MNAETILQSDLLDIIFENRNKQYGAYPLRKEYNKRLYTSLALITGLVLVLFAWYYLQKQRKQSNNDTLTTCIIPDMVDLKKIELPPNEPPPLQKKLPPVATVTNDPPMIVPDNQANDSTHTVADPDNKVISDVTAGGPAATGDNQAAAKPDTTAAAAAPATEPADPAIFENPETMPEFPGGMAALFSSWVKTCRCPKMHRGQDKKCGCL
jgi:protein TonB